MTRRNLLLTAGAVGLVLALMTVLVLLAVKPRPVAGWLELRYALEPGEEAARTATARIIGARLHAAGLRGFTVARNGDELLVRAPIPEPRLRATANAQEATRARGIAMDERCEIVLKLLAIPGQLRMHKVDACGALDAPPANTVRLDYACDERRWTEALTGTVTEGFFLADYSMAGTPQRERLLLVTEPIVDGSHLTRAIPVEPDRGKYWRVLVYLDSIGTAQVQTATSSVAMQHRRDRIAIVMDGEVKMAPRVECQLAGAFEITGRLTKEEAERLSQVLNSGWVPCRLTLKSQQLLPPDDSKKP